MIGEVWNNRELLNDEKYNDAIRNVIGKIDEGELRVAEPVQKSTVDQQAADAWQENEWVKQAILI